MMIIDGEFSIWSSRSCLIWARNMQVQSNTSVNVFLKTDRSYTTLYTVKSPLLSPGNIPVFSFLVSSHFSHAGWQRIYLATTWRKFHMISGYKFLVSESYDPRPPPQASLGTTDSAPCMRICCTALPTEPRRPLYGLPRYWFQLE